MTIHITRSTDPIVVKNTTILIYGSPGVGKTSIGYTADRALLLDFDKGAHRSGFRKDTVLVESWEEVLAITPEDMAEFGTIVVDTVGRLLDFMSTSIIKKEPKMRGFGGALSLQGYGALKAAYATWLSWLVSLGKDVVLIAHDREDKKGDDLILRPDIQGGSYGEVFKRADAIGYLYRSDRTTTILDFSPDRWIGKNPGQFDPYTVPNFNQRGDYLATVIADVKAALNRMSEGQRKVLAEINEWTARVLEAADADAINTLVTESSSLTAPVGPQVKHAIAARAKELGLKYEGKKGQGKFIDPPSDDAQAGAA